MVIVDTGIFVLSVVIVAVEVTDVLDGVEINSVTVVVVLVVPFEVVVVVVEDCF